MYIIVAERNSKFVRTNKKKWAFFHPGVNDNLWKTFTNKEEADKEAFMIQQLPEVKGMTVKVEAL